MWAACTRQCIVGIVMWAACTRQCIVGVVMWVACTRQCIVGIVMWAACTRQCIVGVIMWAACTRQCIVGIVMWAACTRQCIVGVVMICGFWLFFSLISGCCHCYNMSWMDVHYGMWQVDMWNEADHLQELCEASSEVWCLRENGIIIFGRAERFGGDPWGTMCGKCLKDRKITNYLMMS